MEAKFFECEELVELVEKKAEKLDGCIYVQRMSAKLIRGWISKADKGVGF